MCEFGGHLTQIELEAEQNRQSIKESGSSGSYANHSSREPLEKRTGFARFPRLKEFTIDYSTRMHNWKVFDAESVRVRERAIAETLQCYAHGWMTNKCKDNAVRHSHWSSDATPCGCPNCVAYRELTKTCGSIIDPKETEKKAGVENAGASMD